jgi:hypothetical protein
MSSADVHLGDIGIELESYACEGGTTVIVSGTEFELQKVINTKPEIVLELFNSWLSSDEGKESIVELIAKASETGELAQQSYLVHELDDGVLELYFTAHLSPSVVASYGSDDDE